MWPRGLQQLVLRGSQRFHVVDLSPRRTIRISFAVLSSRYFTSSSDPTPPSLFASECDLLQRVHYLRERAIDLERRTIRALEQAGELPQPRKPLASVALRHLRADEDRERLMEEAAQPSPVTDMADWLEDAMERLNASEQRLLAFIHGRQQSSNQEITNKREASGAELEEVAGETDELGQQADSHRTEVNDELQQEEDDTGVRLGPIPVPTGPEEPVWIAVPLRGEGEEGEQRAEEQQAVKQDPPLPEQREAAARDGKHIHGQLPEDKAAGRPERETGVSTAPHSLTSSSTQHKRHHSHCHMSD